MRKWALRSSLAILLVAVMGFWALGGAETARNLVVVLVDGMGPAHRQLGELAQKGGLAMNHMPYLGCMSTSSYGLDITDSAAAATAMFTGRKTYNMVIGYDYELDRTESIMSLAVKSGMSAGIVTTSALYDATSAAMYANVLMRSENKNISKQLLASPLALAVGGGGAYIGPLIKESAASSKAKPAFNSYSDIKALSEGTLPAVCLLAEGDMPQEIDSDAKAVKLKDMVETALGMLSKDGRPFLLLVETGSVDGSSHDNDAASVIKGLLAADDAVKACLSFAQADGNTLVVVAADHETGGLSLGAGNGLNVDVSKLLKVRASAGRMAAEAASDWKRLKEILKTYANYELDDEDAARVRVSADPAKEIGRLISYASNVSWGSGSHTASMVIITAEGPAGACFSGWYDNTEFFLRMRQALGF